MPMLNGHNPEKKYHTRSDIEKTLVSAGIHPGSWARAAQLAKPTKRAKGSAKGADQGSFDWILTTEKPTIVWDWERWEFVEEILLADGMLVPANNQVVLLDSHQRYSVKDVLGHVRNFSEEITGEFPARSGLVFFASDIDSVSAREKVEGNHITDGSVGYQPIKFVWVPEGEEVSVNGRIFSGGSNGIRVTYQWLLKEFSITPIGADVLAKVRELLSLCGA